MATININNQNSVEKDIDGISSISFQYIGEKPTAIQPIDKLIGVFISETIYAESGFLRWSSVTWDGDQTDFNLGFYVRSFNTELGTISWSGPYYNQTFDIDDQTGRNLQILAFLVADGTTFPSLDEINITYISSELTTKFYTKAFDLGFKPETILLTYNADLDQDSVLNFAVAGSDTVNPVDYQYIEPNKIETLSEITEFADQIKVLIELSGEFTTELALHEFALMVGGEDATKINKEEYESSSSSESIETSSSSS